LQCTDSDTKIEYWHNELNLVYKNQPIVQGQIIGAMGDTGNSEGRHIHLVIIKDGERVDPQTYLDKTTKEKSAEFT
jgi:murein DD-endopeptidase MepM/ murein hydrolase activator NlpD